MRRNDALHCYQIYPSLFFGKQFFLKGANFCQAQGIVGLFERSHFVDPAA